MRVQVLGLRAVLVVPGTIAAIALCISQCVPSKGSHSAVPSYSAAGAVDANAQPDDGGELLDGASPTEIGPDAGADVLFDQEVLSMLAEVTPVERDVYMYLVREMQPVSRLLDSRLPEGIAFGYDWVRDWDAGGRESPVVRSCDSPSHCRWKLRATIRSSEDGDWHRVPVELPHEYYVSTARVGGSITIVVPVPPMMDETRKFHSVRELESYLLPILTEIPAARDR